MKLSRLTLLTISATSFLISQFAYAAAFQFYELGAPVNGTAGVGQAALANDASTAYYNPAGMARLLSSQLMLGPQIILPYTNFSPNSSNTITGNNGGNAASLIPGADGYYVYCYSPQLKFGISLTAPYGGALNYNDHWVGRYFVQQMIFYTLNLNPAFGYQINDWAAIGGGISVEYANLYQNMALRIDPRVDGQATLKVDNTSPGFNLGVLFTPTPATKIGIAYRSQIIHNLRGNISFFNLGFTPNATTKMVMPANVIASIVQGVSNNFTLLGELGWSNWSSMKNSIVHVGRFSATTLQRWRNTYRIGVGGQYIVTPVLLLQAGVSFDSSPTNSTRRTPNLPMDRQIRVGTGINYVITRAVNLGLSYEFISLGRASINNVSSIGVLAGHYSRNFANVFQSSLNVEV